MNSIICFIDSLGAGGAQRQLVGLAVLLKNKGYDVTVCTYHNLDFYKSYLEKNVVINEVINGASSIWLRFWYIIRYFYRKKPDCVIAYQEIPSLIACIALFFCKKYRLIVSERNTTQRIGLRDYIRFWLYRKADYIVPNSFTQGNFIVGNYPAYSNKTIIIPNFVDLKIFTPPVRRKRHCKPEILIAASIWESKNTLGFVDAVVKLKERGRNFHISWYGKETRNTDYYNECQKKIVEKRLSQYICLLEKTNNIVACYEDADYFCLPSFYEGTPNVICEAMACGLPILCSDVCDNSRYVEDGINGFLFNPRDVNSMVLAMEKILDLSDEKYYSFCKSSRLKAEEKLSQDSFIEKYLKLIEG